MIAPNVRAKPWPTAILSSPEARGDKKQPLFAIDTSSTPVDLATVKTAEVENIEDSTPEKRLNRKARRRLELIERERKKLLERTASRKVEGEEKEKLMQEGLDQFIMRMDHSAEARSRLTLPIFLPLSFITRTQKHPRLCSICCCCSVTSILHLPSIPPKLHADDISNRSEEGTPRQK